MSRDKIKFAVVAEVISRADAKIVLDVLRKANIEGEISGEGSLTSKKSQGWLDAMVFPYVSTAAGSTSSLTIIVKEEDKEASEKALRENAKESGFSDRQWPY